MAGLSLTQLAKKANAERMAARRRAEAIRAGVPPTTESQPSLPISESQPSLPVIEEGTAEKRSAEAELVVQADHEAEQRVEKRPAEVVAGLEDNCADKRPRMATSISLLADKAAFRAESDLVAIALAVQSALLTVRRITEMGRRHHDAIKQLGHLQTEVEGQRSRAEFEALRAKMEGARAEAEMERARNADELRLSAEKKADASEEALKLAQEAVSKLEAELEEVKKAKEAADSEASKAFEAGKSNAFAEYDKYFPQCFRDRKVFEFQELKQGKMSVAEYEAKFTEFARFAPYRVDTDYKKAQKFEGRLDLEVFD
ncbi:structural maintenance of chromosomes protein 2-like [Camellia sinensis]|uniref:structural maintenance of chromosomes protein 2-like n=1 Tax=Camellia sinensis TaxID=4442 RepID=UPI001036BA68|nr:structural maintenance of chromosomes protein 2-like [Camellia sinensis]